MRGSITIGKIGGVEISIHWTFIVLIGLVLVSSGNGGEAFWNAAFILTIFLCVVLHELGHAMTAKSFGIMTKDIILLPIGGVARLAEMPKKPAQELAVAAAGPIVNIIIVLLLYPFVAPLSGKTLFTTMSTITNNNFLANLFAVNLSLAAFNLLPAFPLDGGRALRAILAFRLERLKATRIAVAIGQLLAIVLGLIGFLYNPMLVFIAIVIYVGAQQEWLTVESKWLLAGVTVNEVLMKQFVSLRSSDLLSVAIEELVTSPNHDFIIFEGDRLVGTLGRNEIIGALSHHNERISIGEVMNTNPLVVDHTTPLEEAYDLILKNKGQFIIVTKEDRLLGVVDLENILQFIIVRQAASHVY